MPPNGPTRTRKQSKDTRRAGRRAGVAHATSGSFSMLAFSPSPSLPGAWPSSAPTEAVRDDTSPAPMGGDYVSPARRRPRDVDAVRSRPPREPPWGRHLLAPAASSSGSRRTPPGSCCISCVRGGRSRSAASRRTQCSSARVLSHLAHRLPPHRIHLISPLVLHTY